jgi:hypothetical protein
MRRHASSVTHDEIGLRPTWGFARSPRPARGLVALCFCLLASAAAGRADAQGQEQQQAQETRASVLAAREAEKATRVAPYVPNKAERIFTEMKKGLIEEPNGFYPYFASVYSGGGFTLGAGYRRFYGDRTHWDVKGLLSIKGYKLIELTTDSWGHQHGRLDLHASIGWRDATQVGYYGLGIDSTDDRTNFRMKQLYVGSHLTWRPVQPFVFGGGLAVEDFTLEEGRGTAPSIEDVFTPETAPGLGVSPAYVHTYASAGIDTRPASGYARRGALYDVAYHNYADSDGTYSFDRVDVDAVQHIPLLRETWVISLRGRLESTIGEGDQVPYFLLPALGSGSTLRAYASWRFRDRHSVLASGEFRWIPNRMGLDMAIFYDAGQVAAEPNDFQMRRLKTDVGVGVRFHGPFATPLRIELAHGREGFNLVFAGSAAF